MTTIFEYKAYLAQIDQTNSYTKLRKMYKSFIDSNKMNNFYRVHCVAKLVSKFKSLTNSHTIKNREYPGVSKTTFNRALTDLTSIENLKSLIKDWPEKDLSEFITLPRNSESLINLSKYVNFDEMFINESGLNKIHSSYDTIGTGKCLELRTRYVLSIVHYLKSIKDTNLYKNILSKEINTHKALKYNTDQLSKFKEDLEEEIKSIEEAIKELQ